MKELITIIGLLVNFIMLIYVIFVIPIRVKINSKKLDKVTKNQTIIEKLIKKVGGIK